ncbi:dodecin family protein [Lysobacter arvi]|uniref:Dodecin family protein n=1 Tax=Lysobacter arvi TaxID=3038776 RepID=A0ABU1CD63_9GAMM|nr:dodecin family protein [Lysobacter arvi]MDR0181987.1 dodecin family protein [Lysobacter arvi]
MSVAKVIEVSASSPEGLEDAVSAGLRKVSDTISGVQGAWVSEIKVRTDPDGEISEWRVCMRVSFVVE